MASPPWSASRFLELTETAVRRLAEHVASITQQSVNSSTPLLSAAMPHGERFQGVLAPAAPSGGAFSIRKQVIANLDLDDYAQMGAFEAVKVRGPLKADLNHYPEIESELAELLQDATPDGVQKALAFAVKYHVTMIISGGTSSGKTTFLNALLKEVPDTERVISIEDTRELQPPQPNWLSLLASKGGQSLAQVTVQDLLEFEPSLATRSAVPWRNPWRGSGDVPPGRQYRPSRLPDDASCRQLLWRFRALGADDAAVGF